MQHSEIVTRLSQISTSEIIYSISMQIILSAIVNRMGEKALSLTVEDLRLARDEVRIAIDHNLDIRGYINMGLDSWDIIRGL